MKSGVLKEFWAPIKLIIIYDNFTCENYRFQPITKFMRINIFFEKTVLCIINRIHA